MLGKLFKYEFKNTGKVILTIYGILLSVAIIGSIVFSFDPVRTGSSTAASVIAGSIMLLYFLSLFALYVVTFIYICIHFYKTMYSDQGYLTHTLPVNPLSTFHVKLVVSFTWIIGAVLLTALSIFILLAGASNGEIFTELASLDFASINAELEPSLGITFGGIIAYAIAYGAVACLSLLLLVFASLSIGQLFNQNKLAMSIVAGVILYFIHQTLAMIFMLSVSTTVVTSSLDGGPDTLTQSVYFGSFLLKNTGIFSPFEFVMLLTLLSAVAFAAIYYAVCVVIIRKHMNLD